jgi:surface protein
MYAMFYSTSFDQPIGSWNVSSVTDMGYMFGNSSFNQDLKDWNVEKVTSMDGMFWSNADFNKDVTGWATNTTGFTSDAYADMFYNATAWQAAYSYTVSDGICDKASPYGPATCWTPKL